MSRPVDPDTPAGAAALAARCQPQDLPRLALWAGPLLLAGLLAAVALWWRLDGAAAFTLERLQGQHAAWQALVQARPLHAAALLAALFIGGFALALPVGALLSLVAGASFGLGWGVVLVSFAASLGASAAFLLGRWLLRAPLRRTFAPALARIDAGLARDGMAWLFSLRLVPLFPPGLLSLLLGTTAVPLARFHWISQAGMLAGAVVYVHAGTQLARLRALSDVLTPGVLASLLALAALPWLLRLLAGSLVRGGVLRRATQAPSRRA